MLGEVVIGTDRIVLTAYNPRSFITRLKCQWLLQQIMGHFGRWLSDDDFLQWLGQSPEGAELVAKLRAGWHPPASNDLTVDPLNAAQEAGVMAHLAAEHGRK